MALTTRSGTGGLTERERSFALGRFQILQPFLEDGVTLVRIAEENHLSVAGTVRRWAKDYRQFGLAGLCRKCRADKRKRRMSPTLELFIEGLALQEPRLTAAAVHRQVALVGAAAGRTGSKLPNHPPHDSTNGPCADDTGSRRHEIVQRPLRSGTPQRGSKRPTPSGKRITASWMFS